jgi:hypothetical protein
MPPDQERWRDEIYSRERAILSRFFGEERDVPPLPAEITSERVEKWWQLDMFLHFLPDVELPSDSEYPGWKVKPYRWFYDLVAASDIWDNGPSGALEPEERPLHLGNRWVLIDERDKPEDRSDNVYAHDFLEGFLRSLRETHIIETTRNLALGTRLYTSWTEWNEFVRPEVARQLEVRLEQVRLPRVIEFNYFGNAIKPQWGETDTWEWLQDACGGGRYRMRGGHRFAGGLAVVYFRTPTGHGTDRGFRPLVDFGN